MHFALLIGYGASAINPYLAIETLEDMSKRGFLGEGVTLEKAVYNYAKSVNKGLLKVFSKMGISTLQSYRGAQVFEAIGLNKELVDLYFTGTASRIEGIGLDVLSREAVSNEAPVRVSSRGSRHGTPSRWQLRLPAAGRIPPAESADHREDAARHQDEQLRHVQRIYGHDG